MNVTVSIPAKGMVAPAVLYDGKVVEVPVVDGWLVIENVTGGAHSFWLSETATTDAETLKENWKAAMFGADANDPTISGDDLDSDGDGATTEEEFIANTDPSDSSDCWVAEMVITMPAGPVSSTFEGKDGRRYALQSTPSLTPTHWEDVDSEILDSNSAVQLNDSSTLISNAFYRTQVELP